MSCSVGMLFVEEADNLALGFEECVAMLLIPVIVADGIGELDEDAIDLQFLVFLLFG